MEPVQIWFDRIYLQHRDMLLKLARRMVGNDELAEDIVQITFEKMLNNYEKTVGHENICGWLVQTLKNQVMNEMKRASRTREVRMEPKYEPVAEDPYEPDFLASLPPGLSDKERKLLYLFFEMGFRHEEVAARLGCSTEACRMRLLRAKAHCQKLMENSSG